MKIKKQNIYQEFLFNYPAYLKSHSQCVATIETCMQCNITSFAPFNVRRSVTGFEEI